MLIEPRTNEAARRGEPLTAANARYVLKEMARDVKSLNRRKAMAKFFADHATNATAEAVAVYREFAESK